MATKYHHMDEVTVGDLWETSYCIICDRPVGNAPLAVHFVDGGTTIWAANVDGYTDNGGDMGWWPGGSTCANRFAPGVLGKYNEII